MYQSMAPNVPPEQVEAQGQIAQERISPVIADIGGIWDREWFPEVRQAIEDWKAYDLERASTPDLLAHFDASIERGKRLWEIHFLLAFPMLLGLSLFDDFYRDLFGDEDAFQAFRLLQGFENKTLESNQELWALSRTAVADPTVRQVFETLAASEIVLALEESGPGRAFLAELRTFLEAYGRRGDTWGLRPPGWIEDPTSVLRNLKDYVRQPDRDLPAERTVLIEERERLLAETRERLDGYPGPVVGQFEELLKAAQFANVLSEEHGFWIDFSSTYEVRLVFLELGKRLADAGVLDDPDGVFFLTLEEIRATERYALGGVGWEVEQAFRDAEDAERRLQAYSRATGWAKQWLVKVQQGIEVGTYEDQDIVDPAKEYALKRFSQMTATFDYNMAVAKLAQVTGWDVLVGED